MGIKVRFDGLDVMAMVSHLNHVALGRRVINIYEGDTSESFMFKLDHNNSSNIAAAGGTTTTSASSSSNTTAEAAEEQDKQKEKLMLYMESGIRFHATNRQTNNSATNSSNQNKNAAILAPFVFQLRKHLRGLRLEQVTQLGHGDRIVHFVFGMGPQRRAVLLELYAKGNIILCDANYTILALLRSHQYGGSGGNTTTTTTTNNNNNVDNKKNNNKKDVSGGGGGGGAVQVQVGHVYPVTYAARNVNVTTASNEGNEEEEGHETNNDDDDNASVIRSVTSSSSPQDWVRWATYEVQQAAEKVSNAAAAAAEEQAAASAEQDNNNNNNSSKGKGNKKKNKKDKQAGLVTLKTLLLKPSSGISHFGPNFLEHCILMNDMVPNTPLKIMTMTQDHDQDEESQQQQQQQQQDQNNNNSNNLPSEEEWRKFLKVFQQESEKLDTDPKKAISVTALPPKGYILYSDKKTTTTTNTKEEDDKDGGGAATAENEKNMKNNKYSFVDKVLEEFQPYLLLKQHEKRKVIEFDTFNEAVDTFYGHLEGQKRLLKAEAAEQAATDKLEKIRIDQQLRLRGLEMELQKVQEQAQVVEYNADNVEKALQVINSALDSGMDWEQLEQLVQVEQEENYNPIALLIYQLDLDNDAMILELPNADALAGDVEDDDDDQRQDEQQEEEEEEVPQPTNNNSKKKKRKGKGAQQQQQQQSVKKKKVKKNHVLVTVSLKETAHGNASQLFASYRAMKEKSQRTVEASTKALKAAEETAQRQLAEAQQRTQQATNTAVSNIKPPWFTKFHWFITSDNYLVLGGRDAHQNESLVKRYLRPGDAYLHADVHGAASCILRAKRIRVPGNKQRGKKATTKTLPLSDQALREAGNFTICRSSAWSSKMVTSAWWVESHQVSKTAPTGEYLKVGAFMIRGKKNFLPPTQLEMGLGVMFRLATPEGTLDPATYARHKNERRDFALMEMLQQQEEDDDDEDDIGDMNDFDNGSDEDNKNSKGINEAPVPDASANDEVGSIKENAAKEEEEAIPSQQEEEEAEAGDPPEPTSREGNDLEGNDQPSETAKEPQQSEPSSTPGKKKKKGLSVKERKLIKKHGSLEEAERVLAEREKEQQEKEKEKQLLADLAGGDEDEAEDQYDASNNGGTMKRGKRGKKKKAMKKYADQDDEDRELAMLALQGGEKVKKNKDSRVVEPTTEEQKQAAAETAALLVKDAAVVAEKLPDDIRSVLAECVTVQNKGDDEPVVRWDKFDADVLDQLISFEGTHEAKIAAAKRLRFLKSSTRVDNFSASLAGILRTIRKYGHENLETEASGQSNEGASRKTKEDKKAESAEWKKTLAEEGVVGDEVAAGDDEEGDIDDTAENNKLTGKPHPEDSLLYAIPVCAPYQTLSQYTFRIKLTPGNMKRGKAAKQCVDMFLKGDSGGNAGKKAPAAGSDAFRDLIKKVGDNDWIQSLCADVKISAAGASKATKKQKANTKAKAKKKK